MYVHTLTHTSTQTQSPTQNTQGAHEDFSTYLNQAQNTPEAAGERYRLDTSLGSKDLDLDAYFAKPDPTKHVKLDEIPLILPNAHNLEVLSGYAQDAFKDLLNRYDIPEPPESISFDDAGKLVLPDNYPYRAQLTAAFDAQPEVLKALSTTAALASHVAALQERQPLHEELMLAQTDAQRNQIIQKYSHLLDDNAPDHRISLMFTHTADMLVVSDRDPEMTLG